MSLKLLTEINTYSLFSQFLSLSDGCQLYATDIHVVLHQEFWF